MYRHQKKITISVEKLDDIFKNFGKMPNSKLAVLIGETYGKLVNNLKVLELIPPKEYDLTVGDENGNFDVDKYFKL